MALNLTQFFKELDEGRPRPLYLVVGEEPFQATEIALRLKAFFLKDENDVAFNYESWDGEHLDGAALRASLETLPGLFGGDSSRLIVCSRFDKVTTSALDSLESYFREPSPSTCFLMLAAKVDRRKGWIKRIEEKGGVIEVSDPYEREWPRWRGHFEKKIGKRIAPEAWERLVESSGRRLSVLWAELAKLVTFVGDSPVISGEAMRELAAPGSGVDVFEFADEVLCRRAAPALRKFQLLLKEGENEIKLLSILVRQFRMVSHFVELSRKGVTDSKRLGAELGTHPFFVSKIEGQARHQTQAGLNHALDLLTECDFRLKTGGGSLFEHFLVPYFSEH